MSVDWAHFTFQKNMPWATNFYNMFKTASNWQILIYNFLKLMKNTCIIWHDHGSWVTIIWAWPYSYRDFRFMFMLVYGSSGYLWRAHHVQMGHHYDFASKMGLPRLDSVRLLVDDDIQHIQGTDIVLRVPRNSINPTKKGLKALIDHTENNYDY